MRCLRSLEAVEYEPLDVIVVDNGSVDGSADAVAAAFPQADLVRLERNRGFAGGMNAGAERALARGADHVLLLNNDTELDPAAPGALVAEAGRRPEAAAVCATIYFREPPGVIWYAGARFDPKRGYQGRHEGYGSREAPASVRETERACGAAMLVPAAVIQELGLFDEELFAYAEDTDWSLRAREAGRTLLVVPEARVVHGVSAATGGEGSEAALVLQRPQPTRRLRAPRAARAARHLAPARGGGRRASRPGAARVAAAALGSRRPARLARLQAGPAGGVPPQRRLSRRSIASSSSVRPRAIARRCRRIRGSERSTVQ